MNNRSEFYKILPKKRMSTYIRSHVRFYIREMAALSMEYACYKYFRAYRKLRRI